MKGGKAGAAPLKRGLAVDRSSTLQKRPRTEGVQAQAPTKASVGVDGTAGQQQQQEQLQPKADKHQDASDAEPGLAGLLGRVAKA